MEEESPTKTTSSETSAFQRKPSDNRRSADVDDAGKSDDVDVDKLKSASVLFVTFTVVGICQGCFFIYVSLLPYLSRSYGLDPVTFGYMQTTAAFIQFATSPFIGRYGDKFGARAVLILNAVCTGAGHLILGLATGVSGIVLSRIATIGQDVRLGSHMMVSEVVPGKSRGGAVAKLAIPMSLGMLIGPALGGLLAKIVSAQQSLLITWVAPVVCIVAMILYIPPITRKNDRSQDGATSKHDDKTSVASLLKQRPVFTLIIIKVLTDVPFMLLAMNITLFVMTEFQLTPQMNGLFMSYNGALALIINIFITRSLAKKYTDDQLLRFAPCIMIVAYLLLSQANSIWVIMAAFIPWNLGYAILESQTVARTSRVAPPGKTGSLMGIQSSVLHFARIIAPILGGYLLQTIGFRSVGWFGALASLCLCLVVFMTLPKEKQVKTL